MIQGYDYIDTGAYEFNNTVRELHIRRRFHDIYEYAQLVIDVVFNKHFDLLRIPMEQVDFHALDQILGLESDCFKQICQDQRLFEYFVQSLVLHSKKSRWPISVIQNSCFFEIYRQLLNRFLPLHEDGLSALKQCDWFSTLNRRSAKTSALRLLRPEVIATAYEPEVVLHTGGGVRSMYPKVYDFSRLLFDNFANCNVVPLYAQVYAINMLVIHYTSFVFSKTSDVDFEKFKQMSRESKMLEKTLKPFLHRWLQSLPFDDIYEELLDIWLYLIYPADASICSNKEKMLLYFKLYSKTFIDLLEVIENRCRVADLTLLSHAKFIYLIVTAIFDSVFCSMYRKLKIEPDEFLEELRQKVAEYQRKNWISSFIGVFQGYISKESEIEKILQRVMACLNGKIDGRCLRGLDRTQSSGNSTVSSFSPLANSTPKHETPDFMIDPRTKLYYLTAKGREQVLQRKASFDFSKSINKSNRSVIATRYEFQCLLPLTTHLSKKYSDSRFVKWLQFHRHSSRIAGFFSNIFLVPSPPRYIPVYSKKIVPRLPQLNLRFMASYPFVIMVVFILFFFVRVVTSIF